MLLLISLSILLTCVYKPQTSDGFEEFYDYIYPDQMTEDKTLKLLEKARQWKLKKQAAEQEKNAQASE